MERRKKEILKEEMGGMIKSAEYDINDAPRIREPRIYKESDVIDMSTIINKARIKYRKSSKDKVYLTHLNLQHLSA